MQSFKTLFLNPNFLPARDLARDRTWASSIHAEHPFALEVVVIGDQLTYLEAPFYNFNCSTPNGSASQFGKAQLERFRTLQQWHHALTLAEMPCHVQSDTTIKMSLETPKTELRLPPSILRKTFFRWWQSSAWIRSSRLKPVVPSSQATEKALKKCKDHVTTAGAFDTNRIPFAASFLRGRINFCWHQHRRRNQAVEASLPLGWVQGLPSKESGWLKGFRVYHLESH